MLHRWVMAVLLLATANCIAARLALLLAIPPGFASAVWPPAGIALAALMRYGYRLWPGVLLGSMAATLTSFSAEALASWQPFALAVSIGVGSSLGALLGAYLITRFIETPPTLTRDHHVIRFMVLGGLVSTVVAASWGVGTVVLSGRVPLSAAAYTWATWWAGDAIGVLVFTPLVMIALGRSGGPWRGRALSVGAPSALAFALVVGFFVTARGWNNAEQRRALDVGAYELDMMLTHNIERVHDVLYALRLLFDNSDVVERGEFHNYARATLDRHSAIAALIWAPTGSDPGAGFQYPVGALADIEQPVHRAMLARAGGTGEVSATPLASLSGAPDGQCVMLASLAIYDNATPGDPDGRELRGFVVLAMHWSAFLEPAIAASNTEGQIFRLIDEHAERMPCDASSGLLRGVLRAGSIEPERGAAGYTSDRVFNLGQRSLYITVSPRAGVAGGTLAVWWVLVSGLGFTGLLQGFLLILSGRASRVGRLVTERTTELTRANAQLEREIEERARAEESLRAAKESAEAANQAKSQFLANMSHEMRTPMNGIIGMTELTLATETTEDQRDYLISVLDSSEMLLALINDILDLSRIEANKLELARESFVLSAVFAQTLQPLRVRARERGLTLTTEIASNIPPTLIGDPMRLRQVLLNLVANALKFTHRGGISIQARCTEHEDDAVVLAVSVADTGIGIPEDKRATIFRAFEQVDSSDTRRYGGTGLGLAICERLIRLMNGDISIDSEVGAGSTFRFTARVLRGEDGDGRVLTPVERARSVRVVSGLANHVLRVLVVEDNPINQKLARKILQRRGHDVVLANNGKEALSIIGDQSFDVIMMDVQMPEMDGLEATGAIRARERDGRARTPIIAMTAHALTDDRARCLAAGMDAYLSKPIAADELVRTVEALARAASATSL